jgi:hypothetical protein
MLRRPDAVSGLALCHSAIEPGTMEGRQADHGIPEIPVVDRSTPERAGSRLVWQDGGLRTILWEFCLTVVLQSLSVLFPHVCRLHHFGPADHHD